MSKNFSNSGRESPESSVYGREEVARRLTAAKSLLLVSHERPDGDALGSMAGLAVAGRLKGKRVQIAAQRPLPRRYEFLLKDEPLVDVAEFPAAAAAADCILVLDTCTWNQLQTWAPTLQANTDKTLVMDHHQTREAVGYARWSDAEAAAVGVMVMEVLTRMGWPMDAQVARAAMTAICSDTGWMRFSNTDSRALKAVAQCLDLGVRPDELYRDIYECDRPQRLALFARALSSLTLACEERAAIMSITRGDFAATGAQSDETENMVNEAMRIGSIEVAALLVESGEEIRVSLRSKSEVDVAALAQQFGGGGHVRAAGFRSREPIAAVAQKIVQAAEKCLKK